MLLLPCPWCGPRDEVEFRYGGQAGIAYPAEPDALSDAAWADYLFMRDNPRGPFAERWYHASGCRRWFDLVRDTATNALVGHDPSGDGHGAGGGPGVPPGGAGSAGRALPSRRGGEG